MLYTTRTLNSIRHQHQHHFSLLLLPHIANACIMYVQGISFFSSFFFVSSKPTNSTCYRLMHSNQSKSRNVRINIHSRVESTIHRFVRFATRSQSSKCALVFALIGSFYPSLRVCVCVC